MITTVTTTTTTVAATSLALIAILTLIILLVKKQMISGIDGNRARAFSRGLNVAIIPLFIVFIVTVAIRVIDIIN